MEIRQLHGKTIQCSHYVSKSQIEIGSLWMSMAGDIITVKDINEGCIEYFYNHNNESLFEDDSIEFQSRYNKII
jgi:hypothetical protein